MMSMRIIGVHSALADGAHDYAPSTEHPGMIARLWRGATDAADADRYLEYLEATGLAEYRATPGNTGVFVLRRIHAGRAEFLLVTFWESMDAVKGFAGPEPGRAVFYPEDDRFLVDRDRHVTHYDVIPGASDDAGRRGHT
jgi:heme-degrading monooxygenase HmoA